MIKLRVVPKEDASLDYYAISKPLWYYFILSFGGGPAVVINDHIFKDKVPLPNSDRMNNISDNVGPS